MDTNQSATSWGAILAGAAAAAALTLALISLGSAIVLIAAYAGSLIYAFTVHRDLFRSADNHRHGHAVLTSRASIALLTLATIVTAVQAEILVGALEPARPAFWE